jgi:hypothetical protein
MKNLKKEKKQKKQRFANIENFKAPEYVVQPHEGEKAFFMFKAAFDKKKKRFDTGFFY